VSNVIHGPPLMVQSRHKRKTSLIGFLDDATAVVPQCRPCVLGEPPLLPVAALAGDLQMGKCERDWPHYVDNGANDPCAASILNPGLIAHGGLARDLCRLTDAAEGLFTLR
jgi:hypothetical protein